MSTIASLALLGAVLSAPAWAQDPAGSETEDSAGESSGDEPVDPEKKRELVEDHEGGDPAAPPAEGTVPEGEKPPAEGPDAKPPAEGPAAALPPPADFVAPPEDTVGGPFGDKPSFEGDTPRFRAWLGGGGGFVAEPDTEGHGVGSFRIGASYGLWGMLRFGVDFQQHAYAMDYLGATPSLDGSGNQRVTLDEGMQDLRIACWFDLLEVLPMDWLARHMKAEISLAPRWVHLANPLFGNWAGALRGGLDLTFYPAQGLHFAAGAATSPRLFGRNDSLSLQGRPIWFNDYHAGLGLDFGEFPRWSFDLGWRADTIVLQHTVRNAHGVGLGLGFAW